MVGLASATTRAASLCGGNRDRSSCAGSVQCAQPGQIRSKISKHSRCAASGDSTEGPDPEPQVGQLAAVRLPPWSRARVVTWYTD